MTHTNTFDTLKFANRLKEAGVPTKQAECQAELMAETVNSELATKHDIELVRKDIMWIKVFGAAFGTAILAALGILLSK